MCVCMMFDWQPPEREMMQVREQPLQNIYPSAPLKSLVFWSVNKFNLIYIQLHITYTQYTFMFIPHILSNPPVCVVNASVCYALCVGCVVFFLIKFVHCKYLL